MNKDLVQHIFSYHPPTPEQAETYQRLNAAFLAVAHIVNESVPEGPGQTAAIRKLSEARMAANAAVALEGRF